MSTLDSQWVVSSGLNGLVAHNSPAWLSLYTAVCKLLDLALALPAQTLPQFQMYRWAFVSESMEEIGGGGAEGVAAVEAEVALAAVNGVMPPPPSGYAQQDFVPYVVRVARLLLQKVRTGICCC